MLPTTLPTITMAAATTSDWVDISGLKDVSIHWVLASGTNNLAIDVSNDGEDAVSYAAAIPSSDVISTAGCVRNTGITTSPFPECVRFVRFVTGAGTTGAVTVHGNASEGTWRSWARSIAH